MSDKPDLEAIEARCSKATPGPWFVGVRTGYGGWPLFSLRDMVGPTEEETDAVREFIMHAREDVPALLARVRELGAENAALRKQVGELCPVGDLDTITSLRVEIALLQEQVAALGLEEEAE